MAFRAVHAQWATVFAHLPDLGCGQTWEAVWKVRRPRSVALGIRGSWILPLEGSSRQECMARKLTT